METVSLIASIVSVIIGGFAIWLSITFYKLSNKSAEETKEASKSIGSSVDRLEILFDRLYSDTFSMMKDTVSDMRKHMWADKSNEDSNLDIEKRATEKIDTLKTEIKSEISHILKQVGKQDSKLQNVQNSIEDIVNKAITTTRRVEVETQEEMSMADVLNSILRFMRQRGGEITSIRRLITYPSLRRRISRAQIIEGIEFLIKEKMIKASGSLNDIETTLELVE